MINKNFGLYNMNKHLKTAVSAAKIAGKVIKEAIYKEKQIEKKGIVNLLTKTDKACEKLIVEKLKKDFPDYKILAEEGSYTDKSGGYRWIVDPLDGTTNFIHSLPFVSVSIALEKDGERMLGVVYNPVLGELFTALKGGGAFLNGIKLNVTSVSQMNDTLVATGFPYERFNKAKRLGDTVGILCGCAKGIRRSGCASMDLCYVAAGRYDLYFEEDLKPWDIAAGMLIVEEAGGLTFDYNGNDVDYGVCDIVACGKEIKPEILKILSEVKR
jgi:myo-inositol-1(or 4)-monophosphatase